MQSTNTATTIEKVKFDEPSESPPTRISTVWKHIAAKPTSSATTAKTPRRDRRGARGVAAAIAATALRRRPSARKVAPAPRLTAPIAITTRSRPSHGISTNDAASAPTNAPAVLKA